MAVSTLLLFSFVIGFMANYSNGATSSVPTQAYTTGLASTTAPVTCLRPTFENPYAIELTPDQPTYQVYYGFSLACEEGHTSSGLPPTMYCNPDGTWYPDPSTVTGGLCYAQCNTTEVIFDDDIKALDEDGVLQTVFDHDTTAKFECTDEGQFSGSEMATCRNGTLDFVSQPACLAYCPINLQDLGEGLYYDIADKPAMNQTNSTFYYMDGKVITYRCSDGYGNPINCTSSDCTSTCDDGTWDPPDIPTCVDIDDCVNNDCENGASCLDKVNSYECQCLDGYNGTHCENNINDCVNNDCKNGATCLDKVNSYECQCPDGYNGTFCGNNIDECSSDPCQHDGTCNDLVNGFNCTCAPGYAGDTCEQVPCGGECLPTQLCNTDNECECRPDYYEDEEDTDNPCKEPTSIDVTIRILTDNGTEVEYKEEYANTTSAEFKALEANVCEPFDEIYINETDYQDCRVLAFTNGSIIVNYALRFVENSTESASSVNETFYEELNDPSGSFNDFVIDEDSIVVESLDECKKGIDKCDENNANCTDKGESGYFCTCKDGFTDVEPLPGRVCISSTEQPTEPAVPKTTEGPEPGLVVWKVVVGVTVPIVGILTITIVSLMCWQHRHLHRTSPASASTKMKTYQYEEGTDSDHGPRPESMMIMNNNGTVQEVVLPWRDAVGTESEFIFAAESDNKGRTQMLPMVDYPHEYGSSSYEDPLGNIVSSYDNSTYQHHEPSNTTELDAKYF